MKNILEELYFGNIRPNERSIPRSEEYRTLAAAAVNSDIKLRERLNAEQKELHEKAENAFSALTGINEAEIFVLAFRLGAQIMLEIIT